MYPPEETAKSRFPNTLFIFSSHVSAASNRGQEWQIESELFEFYKRSASSDLKVMGMLTIYFWFVYLTKKMSVYNVLQMLKPYHVLFYFEATIYIARP